MNAAAGLVEVRVPDMGNFKDVAVIDVLVKPGEKIEPEAPLVTLETEKATMDVPSTVGGVVEKIHIAKGGTVSPGDLIVTVRSEGAAAAGSAGEADAGGSAAGGAAAGGPGAGSQGSAGSPGATAADRASQASPEAAQDFADGTRAAAATGGAPQGASAAAQSASAPAQPGAGGAPTGASKAGTAGAGRPAQSAGQPGGGANTPSSSSGAGSAGSATSGGQASAGSGQPSAGSGQASSGSGQAAGTSGQAARSGNGAGPDVADRPSLPPINEPGFSRAHAGPSVRRFARELGVDLTQVKGGGFKGRVTHDDVKAFVKKFLAAGAAKPAPAVAKSTPGAGGPTSWPTVPVIDFALFGEIETKPLSRIQKISGPRLQASWVNIPHVTQFDEADITDLEEVRTQLKQKAQQAGIKLTPLAFIVRACVKALQEFPLFNSSLDPNGANVILKKYIHVGFAADTPNGLVVPVVRDANRKDVYEIARQLGELSEKARAGKLLAGEMQGGSFTISSLGGIGGTAFTPIINAPEVAILGVSRSAMKPVFRDGAFVPRLILPLSLSYDHRVIDGASAARFTTFLAQTLADPRSLTEAVP
jgi:pyruvate dehydrogenase E2 component (dihydrolipoamide acetyltransferase)